MNPHIILLCICEFREDRRREVPPVVVTVSEVLLRAYNETSLQLEGEDCLDKVTECICTLCASI
jgi:hypothetical protein